MSETITWQVRIMKRPWEIAAQRSELPHYEEHNFTERRPANDRFQHAKKLNRTASLTQCITTVNHFVKDSYTEE